MAKMKECVSCEGRRFRAVASPEEFKVIGTRFRTKVPAERCLRCGETYVDGPGFLRAEKAVAAAVARCARVSAESFQFMRSAMGWRSKHIAELLGVSPVTVSRWENGEREVDPLAWVLVAALVLEENGSPMTARALLERVRNPPRCPKTVVI